MVFDQRRRIRVRRQVALIGVGVGVNVGGWSPCRWWWLGAVWVAGCAGLRGSEQPNCAGAGAVAVLEIQLCMLERQLRKRR